MQLNCRAAGQASEPGSNDSKQPRTCCGWFALCGWLFVVLDALNWGIYILSMCVRLYVCVYVCMFVCLYVCMYVCGEQQGSERQMSFGLGLGLGSVY
jgi:hypothetical protein